jgi:hypothetical protein
MSFAGEWERGEKFGAKAKALNPQCPGWYQLGPAWNRLRQHDFEGSLAEAQLINIPGFSMYHGVLLSSLGHLERHDEAELERQNLVEAIPDFVETFWKDLEFWHLSEPHMDVYVEGLRKAGMNIPDKPEATD